MVAEVNWEGCHRRDRWRSIHPNCRMVVAEKVNEQVVTMMAPETIVEAREQVLTMTHYVKTSNRSHSICNRPLTPVTYTHICSDCCLAPVAYKRARTTRGWPPQLPLSMWTSGNGLLKHSLHKFFVTDVK
jgi:hypothetical protein